MEILVQCRKIIISYSKKRCKERITFKGLKWENLGGNWTFQKSTGGLQKMGQAFQHEAAVH